MKILINLTATSENYMNKIASSLKIQRK